MSRVCGAGRQAQLGRPLCRGRSGHAGRRSCAQAPAQGRVRRGARLWEVSAERTVRKLGTQSPRVSRVQPAETCLRPGMTLHRRAREKRLRRPLQTIQGSSSVERQTGFKPPTSSFPTAGRPLCARQLSGQRSWPCRSEPPGSHDTGHCPGCDPHVDGGRGPVRTGRVTGSGAALGQLGGPQSRVRPPDAPGQGTAWLPRERKLRPRRGARGLAEALRATAAVPAAA